MSNRAIPIDISHNKDLLRLAEEVRSSQTPRVLKKDQEPVAVLLPVEEAGKLVSIQEVLALAGSWGERDWNEVEAELDRIRHESTPTPPIDLEL